MQKRIFHLITITLLTVFNSFSQIVIEGEQKEEKVESKTPIDVVNRKRDREIDSATQLYFNTNWSSTYRQLSPNGDLFGEELGERANEFKANFWSYSFGLRNRLGKHFELEIGLGVTRNGEKYSYSALLTDSAYYYRNKYTFISMPIVAYYTYGEDVKVLGGIGIMPQLFMNHLQERTITTANNTKKTDEVKEKSGTNKYASFTSSAIFRVGVQLKYSPFWSIYIMPEYRIQLGSTFGKTAEYKHLATAIGFNLGLTYQL
jgi:hypothetical protein